MTAPGIILAAVIALLAICSVGVIIDKINTGGRY
jgi:hypothetical protein